MRAFLETTRQERKSQAYEVLSELALRTLERANQGQSTEFTAQNLKAGVAPDVTRDPSGWLSPLWAKLLALEPQWEEGLAETARTLGVDFIPKLGKHPGSPALYYIAAAPLSANNAPVSVTVAPAGGVHYTPEAVAAPAAWLSGALKSGVVRWTTGLRWTLLGGIVVVTLVVLAFVWLMLYLGIRTTRPLSLADVLGIGLGIAVITGLASPYRFLNELFDLRIVMAPSVLTPISLDNVTLEMRRRDADDEVGELAFVRYTAVCPSCDGQVLVDSGRSEFPGRLIGRCRRSAREHVFSFDHVSRIGVPLRDAMNGART
jgi:hypothetical protein